jgi:hypothetical protein
MVFMTILIVLFLKSPLELVPINREDLGVKQIGKTKIRINIFQMTKTFTNNTKIC